MRPDELQNGLAARALAHAALHPVRRRARPRSRRRGGPDFARAAHAPSARPAIVGSATRLRIEAGERRGRSAEAARAVRRARARRSAHASHETTRRRAEDAPAYSSRALARRKRRQRAHSRPARRWMVPRGRADARALACAADDRAANGTSVDARARRLQRLEPHARARARGGAGARRAGARQRRCRPCRRGSVASAAHPRRAARRAAGDVRRGFRDPPYAVGAPRRSAFSSSPAVAAAEGAAAHARPCCCRADPRRVRTEPSAGLARRRARGLRCGGGGGARAPAAGSTARRALGGIGRHRRALRPTGEGALCRTTTTHLGAVRARADADCRQSPGRRRQRRARPRGGQPSAPRRGASARRHARRARRGGALVGYAGRRLLARARSSRCASLLLPTPPADARWGERRACARGGERRACGGGDGRGARRLLLLLLRRASRPRRRPRLRRRVARARRRDAGAACGAAGGRRSSNARGARQASTERPTAPRRLALGLVARALSPAAPPPRAWKRRGRALLYDREWALLACAAVGRGWPTLVAIVRSTRCGRSLARGARRRTPLVAPARRGLCRGTAAAPAAGRAPAAAHGGRLK